MKLPFETWLEQQAIPTDAREMFKEAVVCFKADAHRAALLFSYLGFLLTIRSRVQGAPSLPNGIPPAKWQGLLQKLMDDTDWDPAAFDATQWISPAPAFIVPSDHRKQVEYWRARRNDCAHGKSGEIGHVHVEALWLFLRSTLAQWVVNGSMQGLVEMFRTHFDPALTPPGADYTHLVEKIPNAVAPADLGSFFAQLETVFSPVFPVIMFPVLDLFDRVFAILGANGAVTTSLVNHIAQDRNRMVAFLARHTSRIVFFGGNPARVRKFWHDDIHEVGWPKIHVVAALLRNDMIPEPERNEAVEVLVQRCGAEIPTPESLATLEAYNFIARLRYHLLDTLSSFDTANSRAQLFAWLVESCPLDTATVTRIANVFASAYHPWHVASALNAVFTQNAAKKAEFQQISATSQVALPAHIPSLA